MPQIESKAVITEAHRRELRALMLWLRRPRTAVDRLTYARRAEARWPLTQRSSSS
jgi:hypothetical protein